MAEEVIAESERLFEAAEAQKLYDLLIQHKDSKNDELLWRLARACREVSQLNDTPADRKKELIYEGNEYAKQAVEINPNNGFAHKWIGITLSGIGDYEGNKKKINDAYVIKAEFEKAIELNANDGTSMHLLGQWCYTIAEMPWYIRKVAAAIFAAPPESSYEEALKWFQKCEDSPQASFSRNHLWMGMTYHKLNNKEKAIEWLTKCRDHPPIKDEEVKQQEEAKTLLAKLGVK
ncbi:regulator of microtubule dynamics protein 1-like [Amphiura filiformis]|uniref:regulator of microtubule dynamics protein 1-like n=1 Tax=Amphiura filiformis TaxID=82378 RepID=UPI003B224FDA